jgi:hypothetical protein
VFGAPKYCQVILRKSLGKPLTASALGTNPDSARCMFEVRLDKMMGFIPNLGKREINSTKYFEIPPLS